MSRIRNESLIGRREIVRVGGLSALGLGLGHAAQRAFADTGKGRSGSASKARSCILIWLDGGPSHLETFDVKPNAPVEVRGPLSSIATAVPGIRVSECLPKTAAMLDRIAVIRSVTSSLGAHNLAAHYLLTGYKPSPAIQYSPIGAVVAHVRNQTDGILPPNIAVPDFRVGGGGVSGNGFLPSATRPFELGGDPARADFQVRDLERYTGVSRERLERRREYLHRLDRASRLVDSRSAEPSDPVVEQAFRLVMSPEAKKAFALDQEPESVRRRYGSKSIGAGCLLARRLVERGVPFVTVNSRGWDTHTGLYTRLKEGFTGAKVPVGLVPSLDLAFSALVEDLEQRGLFDQTLVVVMGEFGRTPKLNTAGGRDHWPRVFSVVMAGGGVPGGVVVGSSDKTGEQPENRAVTPMDLAHTVYRLLGIDPDTELRTSDGRPIRVGHIQGEAIKELV